MLESGGDEAPSKLLQRIFLPPEIFICRHGAPWCERNQKDDVQKDLDIEIFVCLFIF